MGKGKKGGGGEKRNIVEVLGRDWKLTKQPINKKLNRKKKSRVGGKEKGKNEEGGIGVEGKKKTKKGRERKVENKNKRGKGVNMGK